MKKKTNVFCDDVHDVLNNVDHVIASGMEEKEESRIKYKQEKLHSSYVTKNECNASLKFTFSIVYFVIMIVLNGMAMYLYYKEKISKTILIAIFFMVLELTGMYDSLIYELQNITRAVGNYNELETYFGSYEIKKQELLKTIDIAKGKIQFKNVSLKYGDKVVFDDLNLIIAENTKVGIIGEIGSGKTTLLKILVGLIDFKGQILIDDFDISKYDHTATIKHIAYIPQNPKLFNRTILENLNYGSDYGEDQINDILQQFDLLDFFKGFKDGLNTNVGKNGEKLSGGQRQLVYIMRSFVQNKKILLFDEPTSALDTQHKQMLINILTKIKNKTMLIVTHDKDILELFDRVLVFDSGKIIKDMP